MPRPHYVPPLDFRKVKHGTRTYNPATGCFLTVPCMGQPPAAQQMVPHVPSGVSSDSYAPNVGAGRAPDRGGQKSSCLGRRTCDMGLCDDEVDISEDIKCRPEDVCKKAEATSCSPQCNNEKPDTKLDPMQRTALWFVMGSHVMSA
mmetsp:Transcript_18427/g.50579  ORF Transcript_18427/g.50579 Transcript_18427/m.50579 type:complete len:146 (-) Transcript_18427:175-612(-)